MCLDINLYLWCNNVMEHLRELVDNYQLSEQTVNLVRSTRLVLLAGISGAGKDTVKRALISKNPIFHDIVSHTTRQPRSNNNMLERDGVDYHFIDNYVAENMLQAGEFVEAKFVHGTVYGTSVAEIQKARESGKIAITDIDVQGVAEFKEIAPGAVSIFIVPPVYSIWVERLKSRYATEDEFIAEWPKRRASSVKELEHALNMPYYHFIINDDLDRAVRVSEEIILRDDVFYEKDNEARILAHNLLDQIRAS